MRGSKSQDGVCEHLTYVHIKCFFDHMENHISALMNAFSVIICTFGGLILQTPDG